MGNVVQNCSVFYDDPKGLSDDVLFNLCREYGRNAKIWMRKFAVLLPEVNRRHLYRKKGFCSVYEFAAKVSGMNHGTVDQILKLNDVLSDKPVLQALVGKEGWSKVRVVASIATKETEKFWAEKVKSLPKLALEMYTREIRERMESGEGSRSVEGGDQNLFTGSVNNPNDFCSLTDIPGDGNTENWTNLSIKLDKETEFRLRLFKQKIEKQKYQKITYNELVKEMLDMIDGIAKKQNEKLGLASAKGKENREGRYAGIGKPEKPDNGICSEENCEPKGGGPKDSSQIGFKMFKSATRYIPVATRRVVWKKHHDHCAYPGCNRPAMNLHHTERFAVYGKHGIDNIVPLCDGHHTLAHGTLIENEALDPKTWRLMDVSDNVCVYDPRFSVDRVVSRIGMSLSR